MKCAIPFLMLFLSSAQIVNAQELSTADAMKKINQIKLDTCYVWADCTSTKNADDAYKNAQAVLNLEIQNWLDKQSQNDVAGAIMPTNDQCLHIQTMRGKMFRAFVYVDKSQIVPYRKAEKALIVEREEVKPVPAKVTKEKKAEQPIEAIIETIYQPTTIEQQMLQVKKAKEIEAFVKSDKVGQFGKYKDRPQAGTYYLLIYNIQGEVPACLKFENGTLTNVSTGIADTFDNYKGCGAYWFTIQ